MTVRRWLAVAVTTRLRRLPAAPAHPAPQPPAPPRARSGAQPVRVVAPGDSIQRAIDASHPGDTVLVRAGTYRENLTVTVPDLTLRGESTDQVILRPPAG